MKIYYTDKNNEEKYVNVNFWSLFKAYIVSQILIGIVIFMGGVVLGLLFG